MAGVMAGGSILSTYLQGLHDKLTSGDFVELFLKRQKLVPLARNLVEAIISVTMVLDDADEKQFKNPAVRQWLDEIGEVTYDLGDLVEEVEIELLQSKIMEGKSQTDMSASKVRHDKGIKQWIITVADKMGYLAKHKDALGLKRASLTVTEPYKLSSVAADFNFENESAVYGRDEDKEALVKSLLSDGLSADDHVDVIAMVGISGVGKTTLAQLVYNDDRVKKQFDIKAWVSVSGHLDASKVTKAILTVLSSQPIDTEDLLSLQVRLKENLKMKKFLLVLDDVWSNKNWKMLQSALTTGARGSKIFVTTHDSYVAAVVRSLPASNHLEPLTYEDSLKLFEDHAFPKKETALDPKLASIGKEIVKLCQGQPLAVKLLGACMRFKPTLEEWDAVLKSNIFDTADDKSGISSFLQVSYHSLPAHLKRCFAYCSLFPRSFKFKEEDLIRLWMAEGLLPQPKHGRMEDVGHELFLELSLRCFFQPTADKSCYVMHDLLYKLAAFVSQGIYTPFTNDEPFKVTRKTRHLSYYGGNLDAEKCKAICETELLRTLILDKSEEESDKCNISDYVLKNLLEELPLLQVLSLSNCHITEVPNSIGRLKHLRYLDLSHNPITGLPESVGGLINLQLLKLSGCPALTKMPSNLGSLINLKHLDISGTSLKEMPADISKLTDLRTLSNFIVGKYSGSKIKELGALSNLQGALHISQLQNVVTAREASEANLKQKKQIHALELKWSSSTQLDSKNHRDVLEQLQPHKNLKDLGIRSYNDIGFPDWLGDSSFSNMVQLRLSNCNNCRHLPPLGQLPSLKALVIEEMKAVEKVGAEFYGTVTSSDKLFPALGRLVFQGMLKWQEWISPEGEAFPCLQEIRIHRCPKLNKLPNCIESSKVIEVSECPGLPQLSGMPHLQSLQTFRPPRHPVIEELKLGDSNMVQLRIDDDIASQYSEQKTEATTITHSYFRSSSKVSTEDPMVRFQADVQNETSYPEESFQVFYGSGSLKVTEISQLMELPPGLQRLKIADCDALKSMPEELSFSNPYLQQLYITDCCFLESFHGGYPPTTLKTLYIRNCRKLELLSPEEPMRHYPFLRHLCIKSSCDSLKSVALESFPKLRNLVIWDCANFSTISILNEHISMDALEIGDCPKLHSFPTGGLLTPNLTSLVIHNCRNLKTLPEQLYKLTSLESLFINECPELESFPKGGFPDSLTSLCLISCQKLTPCKSWGLHRLENLTRFELEFGCRNLVSFPAQQLLPRSLKTLHIRRLPDLKFLDYSGLQNLMVLKTLEINSCNKLQCLPEEGLPSSLTYLYINDCPSLKPKLQKRRGKDWYKIAHIPCIQIDQVIIS